MKVVQLDEEPARECVRPGNQQYESIQMMLRLRNGLANAAYIGG